MLIYVKAIIPPSWTRARGMFMQLTDIAADENAASRKNVGGRAQLKLDTVQQLGELAAGDIERRLFSGKAIVVQETTAVVPVFRRVALSRHAAPRTSAASVRAMNDAIPRDS